MLDSSDSNTPSLHRVHYISLIKLRLAPAPQYMHRAVQRLHTAILFVIKRKHLFLCFCRNLLMDGLLDVSSLFQQSWNTASLFQISELDGGKGKFLSRPQLFGDNRDSEVDFIWSLHITKGVCCGSDDIYCENPQGKWPAELITTVFWTVTSQLRREKGLAFQNISAFFNSVHAIYCIGVYIHKPTFYFLTGPHSASCLFEHNNFNQK